MLKINPNPTFWAKVGISIAGQAQPEQIEVEFRYLNKEAVKTYFEGIAEKSDAEALAEIIANWRGVDEAYSADALQRLLANYPPAAFDLFEAFRRELLEAKRKN